MAAGCGDRPPEPARSRPPASVVSYDAAMDGAGAHRLISRMHVPIALGHRVEVSWLGGEEPRIVDLETGVEYDSGDLYANTPSSIPQRLTDPEPKRDLRAQSVLRGTVRRCVVTRIGNVQQTLLVSEREAAPGR